MTTAKNPVFIGLYLENCCLLWGGDQLLVGEIKFGGGNEQIFGWQSETPPPLPPIGKTLNRGWGGGLWLRIWNFLRYQRHSMWSSQQLIKSEVEFPWVTKKKYCGISRGLRFWAWNFQGITEICKISKGGALFCLGFQGYSQVG